ncbi:MAG TPA: TIGR03435 family protein [Bryobacteraceae bacterium]|jgi:uncharacterized protein (TIGR03435 family)|nr:TIGR03435 family protein [Bryobacteraceae bacterium]
MAITVLTAQSLDEADWQTAAGGKRAFEVAAVKPTRMPRFPPTLFPLDNGNAKTAGGRFSATFPLRAYVFFAYKLSANELSPAALAKLPKWVSTDIYDIEGRAEGNPTKDQMRLMMQSLLADRFKLAVHFETREGPVFALTLVKPGKTGPKLRPHAQGPPCPDSYTIPAFTMPAPGPPPGAPPSSNVFPPNCDTVQMRGNGVVALVGSRNATMSSLAEVIYLEGFRAGEVDRPVVNRTGLSGTFDFILDTTPISLPGGNASPPDQQGASFLTTVREQLGLKLESSKGPIRTLIIDHVERPSEN